MCIRDRLQLDAVRSVGLLLQQGALPDVVPQAQAGAVEEVRVGGLPTLEGDPRTKVTVDEGDRALSSQGDPGREHGSRTRDAAAGVDDDAVAADPVGVDLGADVDAPRSADLDPLGDQGSDGRGKVTIHAADSMPGPDLGQDQAEGQDPGRASGPGRALGPVECQ